MTHTAYDDLMDRDLFVIHVQTAEEIPTVIELASGYFVCLLAWDATNLSAQDIGGAVRKLMDQGCVYFCTWGPDCERVHDIIDEEEVGDGSNIDENRFLMTTWHENESLGKTLWFVLNSTWACDAYEKDCRSTLAISIGNLEWRKEIYQAFSNPRIFPNEELEREG